MPSASLIPAPEDTSTLLTIAGMQPFKPYFRGEEKPPRERLTSCQKCFRTPDIEEVGNTRRHLTFFEMLGNWSFGDYFKDESIAWGLELSVDVFGLDPERIWVTVFGGDEELGLGPDQEAIEIWKARGIPEERIVLLPRSENFWQAGLDRALRSLLGDVPGPRARVRRAGGSARRRHGSLPRVLEPRLHELRAARGRLADAAARATTSTPGWAWSGWRPSCRGSGRCSRPTPSGR